MTGWEKLFDNKEKTITLLSVSATCPDGLELDETHPFGTCDGTAEDCYKCWKFALEKEYEEKNK